MSSSPLQEKYEHIQEVIQRKSSLDLNTTSLMDNDGEIPKPSFDFNQNSSSYSIFSSPIRPNSRGSRSLLKKDENEIEKLMQMLNEYEERMINCHVVLSDPIEDLSQEEEVVSILEDYNDDMEVLLKKREDNRIEERIQNLLKETEEIENENNEIKSKISNYYNDIVNEETLRISEELKEKTKKLKEIYERNEELKYLVEKNKLMKSMLEKLKSMNQEAK